MTIYGQSPSDYSDPEIDTIFPSYVSRRDVEARLSKEIAKTKESGDSRVVLLYGLGGTGKTRLVRNMRSYVSIDGLAIIPPVDVDDPEYWVLANLQLHVAKALNGYGGHFDDFISYIDQVSSSLEADSPSHVSYLFQQCYAQFINKTGLTPVITLDTVEAVRGTLLLQQISLWMKDLKKTAFVLAGRPLPESMRADEDPIIRALEDPVNYLEVEKLPELKNFTHSEAESYIDLSPIAPDIDPETRKKLLLLSQGHPLWLALSLYYLGEYGLPTVLKQNTSKEIEAILPFPGGKAKMWNEGEQLHLDFIRSLLTPFIESNFWSEAIKCLAVARQWIDERVWKALMEDHRLPVEVKGDWHKAWDMLRAFPWVRERAHGQYVTLQDALAEQLNHYIIPLHEWQHEWRSKRWKRAAQVFDDLTADAEVSEENQGAIRQGVIERRRHQQMAASLYYAILCDSQKGSEQFIKLFDLESSFGFKELLVTELQTFLAPGTQVMYDAIRPVMDQFKDWLGENLQEAYALYSRIADYLIRTGQYQDADKLLTPLLDEFEGDDLKVCHLYIFRGNARTHIKDMVLMAEDDFVRAKTLAESTEAHQEKLVALKGKIYREMGWYYRNIGKLTKAAEMYRNALQVTDRTDEKQQAAINANLAYVLALRGDFARAENIARNALAVRERLGIREEMAMSHSVLAEIYRYDLRYAEAWEQNAKAEAIFTERNDYAWLGRIKQQQAICLHLASLQGANVGDPLFPTPKAMQREAKRLIREALDICNDFYPRAMPFALHRAARILGAEDAEIALEFFDKATEEAENVQDGQCLFSSLVEKAELCYREWQKTHEWQYYNTIADLRQRLNEVSETMDFPELQGRWMIVQGHLLLHEALFDPPQSRTLLEQAVEKYAIGFPNSPYAAERAKLTG